MPRKNSANFIGMNRELSASDDAIAPLLAAAKILTVKVDGKDVPVSEAPLQARIAALGGLLATGDKTIDDAQLIAANGQLASQVTDLEGKLTVAQATSSAQAQKIVDLDGKLTVATGSVTTLTAKNVELTGLLEATTKEAGRLTSLLAAGKLALARKCLSCDAVKFNGTDGNPLKADCSDSDLASAAKDTTFDSMLSAFSGALHAAAGKLGITLGAVPSAGTQPPAAKKETATEECARLVREQKAKGTWKGSVE